MAVEASSVELSNLLFGNRLRQDVVNQAPDAQIGLCPYVVKRQFHGERDIEWAKCHLRSIVANQPSRKESDSDFSVRLNLPCWAFFRCLRQGPHEVILATGLWRERHEIGHARDEVDKQTTLHPFLRASFDETIEVMQFDASSCRRTCEGRFSGLLCMDSASV